MRAVAGAPSLQCRPSFSLGEGQSWFPGCGLLAPVCSRSPQPLPGLPAVLARVHCLLQLGLLAEAMAAICLNTKMSWKRPLIGEAGPRWPVAGTRKASLSDTSWLRLSICSLEHLWWSAVFPWAGLSWSLGAAGKGQTRPRYPGAGRPDRTWQRPCPELGLVPLPPDLGDVTEIVGDVDRGPWCGQAWLWGPGQWGDLRKPAPRLGPLRV